MNIYRIMIANAIVLIGLGVFGYFISGSPTALIAPGIGLILDSFISGEEWEQDSSSHSCGSHSYCSNNVFVTGIMRSNMIVIIMAIFTAMALFMYIMDFMKRKQEREKTSNPWQLNLLNIWILRIALLYFINKYRNLQRWI